MKRILSTVLLGMAFTGLAVADDAEKALKEMEGTYSLKTLKKGDMAAPPEVIAGFKGMVIKGDRITLKMEDKDQVAKLKLDPAKKPSHIDVTPTEGPEKDRTMQGIYKFEKGILTIVMVHEGDRPKDFKDVGEQVVTLVFEKKKAE